jgi:hypothetical protein
MDRAGHGRHWDLRQWDRRRFAKKAGQEEGYRHLDGVWAVEHHVGAPRGVNPRARWVSRAGRTATGLHHRAGPSYAPALDLVGAAEVGVAANYVHKHRLRERQPGLVGDGPGRASGPQPGVPHRPRQVPVPARKAVTAQVSAACLGAVALPPTTLDELLVPQYRDIFAVPVVRDMFNRLIVSRIPPGSAVAGQEQFCWPRRPGVKGLGP